MSANRQVSTKREQQGRKATHDGTVTLSDRQLMAAVSSGSAPAFGELYDRYSDRAYQLARSVCGDSRRAEEAVQVAFISIWKHRASYLRQPGTIAAWLLTAVLDAVRSIAHQTVAAIPESEPDPPPAATDRVHGRIEDGADARRMRALLERLPDAQREIITLAIYGGLSHTEIAARLELPAGTVKGRMRLGLQKIQADSEPDVA